MTSAPKGSPNVLVVLYGAVGCAGWSTYGGRIQMPTLDRLASNGLTYSQWHTTEVSLPEDSCFITGRDRPAFTELSAPASDMPGHYRREPDEAATLASVLRDAGWSTCWIGRRQGERGRTSETCAPRRSWPMAAGFERFHDLGDAANHAASDAADAAIEFLRAARHSSVDRPWYLSYCPGTDYATSVVPRAFLDRYRGKFDDGYDAYRCWALARMIERRLLPADTKLAAIRPARGAAPGDLGAVRSWRTLSADERSRSSGAAELYAATSEYADAHIGRIVEWLEESGQLDNTLILYGADNGASGDGSLDASMDDLAFFDSFPVGLRGVVETEGVIDSPLIPRSEDDALAGWLTAFSTPHRALGRSAAWAGSQPAPMLIHWPSGINARGEVRHQYHHCTDVLPTILECCGLEMPEFVAGVRQSPLAGVSMRYTFEDLSAATTKRTQWYDTAGVRSIWHEGWKATIEHAPMSSLMQSEDYDRWRLFHTDADRAETADLAAMYPEKVRELSELWLAEARSYDARSLDDVAIMKFVKCETGIPVPVSGRYVYHAHLTERHGAGVTITQGRALRIFAQIDIEGGAEGLICAQRSPFGSYALRLKACKLCFEHEFFGISSEHDLFCDAPARGRHVVGVEITRNDHHDTDGPAGHATLFVDGERSTCVTLRTMTGRFPLCGEGLTIGDGGAAAALSEHDASSSLVGARVIKIVFDVAEEAAVDAPHTAGTKGQYVARRGAEYSSGAAVAAHILPR